MIFRDLCLSALGSPSRNDINENSQCITYLMSIELGKIENEFFRKLCVELILPKESYSIEITGDKICTVAVPFDIANYQQLNTNIEKKYSLLDGLYKGISFAAESLGFNLEPFDEARKRMIAGNLETEFVWNKAKWNRRRTYQAEVFYNFTLTNIELGIAIYSKSGDLAVERIFAVTPAHTMFIDPYLGQLVWKDESTVELLSKVNESKFVLCIDRSCLRLFITQSI